MRKSTFFFVSLMVMGISLFSLLFLHPAVKMPLHGKRLEKTKVLVERLGLTDLSLFTEARYTRHISMSDLHSAFQEHPVSMEHFPSGSFVAPPMISHGENK